MKKLSFFTVSFLSFFLYFLVILPNTTYAATQLYVANVFDNNVSIIDPTTQTTLNTIPVGSNPNYVATFGQHVYVGNNGSQSISVIDTSTNTVTTTIPVNSNPYFLLVSHDGTKLYVSDAGGGGPVTVIDTATNSVVATLTGFAAPEGMALTNDDSKLYVVSTNCCTNQNGFVTIIDTNTYSVLDTITVNVEPNAIVLSPDNSKAYVTNNGGANIGNTVSVIDTATNTVIDTITVGVNPKEIAINSNGTRVYTMNTYYWQNQSGGTVSVIDTSNNTVIATVPVGDVPNYFIISQDDSRLYVSKNNANSLAVIDTSSNTVIDTIAVGNTPYGIAEVNVGPTVGNVTVSPNPVTINTTVTASTTFTDTDSQNTHSASVNWGDTTGTCTVSEPNGSTPGSVSCTRSAGYPVVNVYPVTITVSDGSAQSTSSVTYASVYNPIQSSIFSAGSQFTNPTTANPNTAGKVKFGLSYKYQGGSAVGNKPFSMDFKDADLHFDATSVNTLVITNNFALLQGTGKLNGASGYTFLVTGVDGGGIRIKITNASNQVIYDTQPGDSTSATPTTNITGHVVVN